MLFLLALACTKSSKEIERIPNEDMLSSKAASVSLGVPKDSVCRSHVPPEVDREGCVVTGPYQGHIEGNVLSEKLDLKQALEACITNPKCTGVSTEWYSDTPFVAMQKTAQFRVNSDSYGCSFIVTCTQ